MFFDLIYVFVYHIIVEKNKKTLTISGPALHGLLFIEIQLKELTFVKFGIIVNPVKSTFLTNPNIFIYTMLLFFIKYL